MTKNITVTDEYNNVIGTTYIKRAKGLVKKGKARWSNTDTICLRACETEDITMANNIYEVIDNQMSKIQEQISTSSSADNVRCELLHTLSSLAKEERRKETLAVIREQLEFIKADAKQLSGIDISLLDKPDMFLISRESTKQEMLKLMQKLLDDEPEQATEQQKPKLEEVSKSGQDLSETASDAKNSTVNLTTVI